MRKLNKKLVVAIAAGSAAALTVGGVAFAFWTGTGAGSGSAATAAGASASDLVVTQAAVGDLYPGGPVQTLSGTVTNKAASAIVINTVTASISVTGAPGCSADDYTLDHAAMAVGATGTELAKDGVANFSGATLAFNNKLDTNQNGCKGATVTISYAVS